MAAQRRVQATMGQPVSPITPGSFRQGLSEYLDWLSEPDADGIPRAAHDTILNSERHIRGFLAFLNTSEWQQVERIQEVHRASLAAWRDQLISEGKAAATINSMLASLAAWFNWAVDHGFAHESPAERLLRCKINSNGCPTSPLTDPETMREALWAVLNRLDAPKCNTILLLACTGMRSAELRMLPRDAVDIVHQAIHVPRQSTERTKRHERTIPLCPQALKAAQWLHDRSRGPHLIGPDCGTKAYTSALNKWLTPLGEKPHTLRRLFYTALKTLEAPQDVIDALMGHSVQTGYIGYRLNRAHG